MGSTTDKDPAPPQPPPVALTIRQPTMSAVLHPGPGRRHLDNRYTPTEYRGPVALHAGMQLSRAGIGDRQTQLLLHGAEVPARRAERFAQRAPRRALVGVAMLTDCHLADGCYLPGGPCAPWGWPRYGGQTAWHWRLDEVRPLPAPLPLPGMIGLWELPGYVQDVLAEMLGRVPCPC